MKTEVREEGLFIATLLFYPLFENFTQNDGVPDVINQTSEVGVVASFC